jgi:hypothetical protein
LNDPDGSFLGRFLSRLFFERFLQVDFRVREDVVVIVVLLDVVVDDDVVEGRNIWNLEQNKTFN